MLDILQPQYSYSFEVSNGSSHITKPTTDMPKDPNIEIFTNNDCRRRAITTSITLGITYFSYRTVVNK